MSTLNLALTLILTAIVGFMMGNVYGQQKMKLIFNDLLNKLAENMKAIGTSMKKGDSDIGSDRQSD